MFYKKNRVIAMIYSALLIILLVFVDQFSKFLAVSHLKGQPNRVIINGVFQLHYLENTGAAFSMLEGKQTLFAILTPIMLIIMAYILFKMPQEKKYTALNYVIIFIFAGAVGNYIDRILNSYVVDFLYFSLIDFPVFNIADCYVTVAIIVFVLLILFYYKDEDFEEIKQSLAIRKNG